MIVATPHTKIPPLVGMGQIVMARDDQMVKAVLGSCIGIVIYSVKRPIACLAHVVLPSCGGRDGLPGKCADTALPHMLAMLQKAGATPGELRAKMAGGANMFGHQKGPLQVGNLNREAVLELTRRHNIPMIGENVGGTAGRRITFRPDERVIKIEIVGQPPITL